MSGTMRRWEMRKIGRDALELKDVPIPVPKSGEVLVKVAAASLNYRDKFAIETGMGLPLAFPFTPGSDLAGMVEVLGDGAARFQAGDRGNLRFYSPVCKYDDISLVRVVSLC